MIPPSSSSRDEATLINGRVSAPGIGVWTEDESKRFRVALETFPDGPWSSIAAYVGTRTVRQTMTHAQKCKQRLERHARGLKPAGRKRRHHDSGSASEHSLPNSPTVADAVAPQTPAGASSSDAAVVTDRATDLFRLDSLYQYLDVLDEDDVEFSVEDLDAMSLELDKLEPDNA